MQTVIICSPYRSAEAAKRIVYLAYVEAAMVDSFARGEAPFASHRLYPVVLNDNDEVDRNLGMTAAKAWIAKADVLAVYTEHGISEGMKEEIAWAESLNIPRDYRQVGAFHHGE